ncbi:MAG: hypothetical protein J2P22_07315 [Nocardioides sp.]|nr:hypothetical protein [Nocardioides sp.]
MLPMVIIAETYPEMARAAAEEQRREREHLAVLREDRAARRRQRLARVRSRFAVVSRRSVNRVNRGGSTPQMPTHSEQEPAVVARRAH